MRVGLLKWFDSLDRVGDDEEGLRAALLSLVRWFDTTVSPADPARAGRQALTRAIAAGGRVLIRHQGFGEDHPAWRTVAAADEYSSRPGVQTYEAYVDAATRSYPYGAGDGCYKATGPAAACACGERPFASTYEDAYIAANAGRDLSR